MYTHTGLWIRMRDAGFLNYQVSFAKETYDRRVFFPDIYLCICVRKWDLYMCIYVYTWDWYMCTYVCMCSCAIKRCAVLTNAHARSLSLCLSLSLAYMYTYIHMCV